MQQIAAIGEGISCAALPRNVPNARRVAPGGASALPKRGSLLLRGQLTQHVIQQAAVVGAPGACEASLRAPGERPPCFAGPGFRPFRRQAAFFAANWRST